MIANVNEMRYRILVQQQADRELNGLIPDIRTLLDKLFTQSDSETNNWKKWKLEHKQLSNLLGVCGETNSVEVVISFIEYQIGRDKRSKTPNNWAWKDFGKTLKDKLQKLEETAKSIVRQAIRDSNYTLNEADQKLEYGKVWMELVRLYVGHLRRYFVYKKPD